MSEHLKSHSLKKAKQSRCPGLASPRGLRTEEALVDESTTVSTPGGRAPSLLTDCQKPGLETALQHRAAPKS